MSGMHRDRIRLAVQLASAALINGYAAGWAKGEIFTGSSKMICVPVLNCYSCPGALGSCPIGSMQAVAGGAKHNVSFYVLGILMLFGVILGRLVCGFLCPFGLVQDLLHKIPVRKVKLPSGIDRPLRYFKYVILALFVIILPVAATNQFGIAAPYFCKYICPAGTLEGGIPLMIMNADLRRLAGAIFGWKFAVLIAIVIGSMLISRFFCRYLCPLGAFYALFNKVSLYSLELDKEKCVSCGSCERVCPMAVEVTKNINSAECIRCGRCRTVCPAGAISSGVTLKLKSEKPASSSQLR